MATQVQITNTETTWQHEYNRATQTQHGAPKKLQLTNNFENIKPLKTFDLPKSSSPKFLP